MKTKIEKIQWYCHGGEHEATGSRYSDFNGNWNCEKHTEYLK